MFEGREENSGGSTQVADHDISARDEPQKRARALDGPPKPPAALQESQPQERNELSSEQKPKSGGEEEKESAAAKPRPRRRLLLIMGLVAAVVLGIAGYVYWDHTAHFESTDDAFIAARQYLDRAQGLRLHRRGARHRQ